MQSSSAICLVVLLNVSKVKISFSLFVNKNVRSKSLFASVLDDIEGIGPKRKKQLLNHFKSVKRMKEASLEELQELLPDKVAEELFQSLQED